MITLLVSARNNRGRFHAVPSIDITGLVPNQWNQWLFDLLALQLNLLAASPYRSGLAQLDYRLFQKTQDITDVTKQKQEDRAKGRPDKNLLVWPSDLSFLSNHNQ